MMKRRRSSHYKLMMRTKLWKKNKIKLESKYRKANEACVLEHIDYKQRRKDKGSNLQKCLRNKQNQASILGMHLRSVQERKVLTMSLLNGMSFSTDLKSFMMYSTFIFTYLLEYSIISSRRERTCICLSSWSWPLSYVICCIGKKSQNYKHCDSL